MKSGPPLWLLRYGFIVNKTSRKYSNFGHNNRNKKNQGPVVRSLVSTRGIKTYRFPWYLTLVSAKHASINPGQYVNNKNLNTVVFENQITCFSYLHYTTEKNHNYNSLPTDEKEKIKTLRYIMDMFSDSQEAYHEIIRHEPSLPLSYLDEACQNSMDSQWNVTRTPGECLGAEHM